MRDQLLDSMDLERERGITIKAQAVRVARGRGHELNLIDTPGHVDFTYEVSRSLAACEGAVLVVDAAQGIEAQTLANAYLAIENDLEIVPVVNKIDLPSADPDGAPPRCRELLGGDRPTRSSASRPRRGSTSSEVLEAIVERIPRPKGEPDAPAARAHLRLELRPVPRRDRARPRRRRAAERRAPRCARWRWAPDFDAEELGFMAPQRMPVDELEAGEVGYRASRGSRTCSRLRVGDT